jgi:hypothetical protein
MYCGSLSEHTAITVTFTLLQQTCEHVRIGEHYRQLPPEPESTPTSFLPQLETYTIGRIKRLGSTPKDKLLQLATLGQ